MISYHIISYYIISYHIILWYHTMSYHVISYHIILHFTTMRYQSINPYDSIRAVFLLYILAIIFRTLFFFWLIFCKQCQILLSLRITVSSKALPQILSISVIWKSVNQKLELYILKTNLTKKLFFVLLLTKREFLRFPRNKESYPPCHKGFQLGKTSFCFLLLFYIILFVVSLISFLIDLV